MFAEFLYLCGMEKKILIIPDVHGYPYITPHFACLDCRYAFVLDEKGIREVQVMWTLIRAYIFNLILLIRRVLVCVMMTLICKKSVQINRLRREKC